MHGHSMASKQLVLLKYGQSLLPNGASVFLAGDTAFGSVKVFRKLDECRWFYVLRHKTSTHVWFSEQPGWLDFGGFVQKSGQSV